MNPHKKYFDEPIVRAKIDKINFPNICPVCCAPATDISIMSATRVSRDRYLRLSTRISHIGFGLGAKGKETRFFRVPACEDHYISEDEDYGRIKAYCIIFDMIVLVLLFFAFMVTSHDLRLGRPVASWVYAVIVGFVLTLILTRFVFNLNPLESAIRIIGFDKNMANIWFKFENIEYRDKFIEENPMSSELVRWVIKA